MATEQDVRTLALTLPRTEEALVRDQVKFRVGRLVYLALSRDERSMGFAFPKEERESLIASDPEKFFMPVPSDERFNWMRVRLAPLDEDELTELVVGAWAMVVPKRLSADRLAALEAKAARRDEPAGPEKGDGASDG